MMGKILRLEEISLNEPLSDALYDCDGLLLMKRGAIITAGQIKALSLKGLKYLELGAPASEIDNSAVAVATLEQIGESKDESPWGNGAVDSREFGIREQATWSREAKPAKTIRPLDPSATKRVNQLVARAATTVEELGRSLADGTLRDATPIRHVADELFKELQNDSDIALAAAIRQIADQQLALRSVQLCVLSIAIARSMKLPESECSTVGSAALLHDMALFELPEDERHSKQVMRPEARRIYESHPAIAYDMLERVRDIDGTVRIIVLQAHEQADGTGFPRRITMARTHRLARIVNLADAYLTLVGCGSGGQGILPADAIAYLMHHTCLGKFDASATCGLVRSVSIYPVGSFVKLSDDRSARVVRATEQKPVTPIVEAVDALGREALVDLCDSDVTIVRPIDEESLERRRLPASDLDKILW